MQALLPAAGALATAALCGLGAPSRAAAQAQPERTWHASGEIGGAMFFGNSSSLTSAASASVSQTTDTHELSANASFGYGVATDRDGETFVNKRSWAAGAAYDHHPHDRLSPFGFARWEGSLELAIDLRTNLGAGAKLTFVDQETSRADVSVALLLEQTNPSGDVAADDPLVRWSIRLRGHRALAGERIKLDSETNWRPRLGSFYEFTLSSTNGVAFVLTDRLSGKLGFVDTFDSEALKRGARSRNDGQILLSLVASW